jgi:hypothetical protein
LSRVEISRLFTRGFFAQNVCKSSPNMRVLVLRFLWFSPETRKRIWKITAGFRKKPFLSIFPPYGEKSLIKRKSLAFMIHGFLERRQSSLSTGFYGFPPKLRNLVAVLIHTFLCSVSMYVCMAQRVQGCQMVFFQTKIPILI